LKKWEEKMASDKHLLLKWISSHMHMYPPRGLKIGFAGFLVAMSGMLFAAAIGVLVKTSGVSFIAWVLVKVAYFFVFLGILIAAIGILIIWGEMLVMVTKKIWPNISKKWPKFPITIVFQKTGEVKKFKRVSDLTKEMAYLNTDSSEDIIVVDSKNRKVRLFITSFKTRICELL
jgi:hypothetical protein